MPDFEGGQLVEYPRMRAWGPGKVVHVGVKSVHVFFRDAEGNAAKPLKADQLELRDDQSDPILDNLPPFRQDGDRFVLHHQRVTPQQAIDFFLSIYPGGFHDPGYIGDAKSGERTYKWAAHERYVDLLGGGQLDALIRALDSEEITRRVVRIVSGLNLLFVTEHAAFREALENPESSLIFYAALADLLKSEPFEGFGKYAIALGAMNAKGNTSPNKWTVATILPFLAQPNRHVFVKPKVFQEAAARFAFDIRYESTPNPSTYRAILTLCQVYWDRLQPLRPRDLIDVQSFLWTVSSAYDVHVSATRK